MNESVREGGRIEEGFRLRGHIVRAMNYIVFEQDIPVCVLFSIDRKDLIRELFRSVLDEV